MHDTHSRGLLCSFNCSDVQLSLGLDAHSWKPVKPQAQAFRMWGSLTL